MQTQVLFLRNSLFKKYSYVKLYSRGDKKKQYSYMYAVEEPALHNLFIDIEIIRLKNKCKVQKNDNGL